MTIKQLIEMFKYYTTGNKERELWLYIECEYDGVVLYCDKIGKFYCDELKKLYSRKVSSWRIGSVFGRTVVYATVFK